jgi:signal transduction histidine kinase
MVALAVSNARLMDSLGHQMIELQATTERLQAVFDSVGNALILFDERGDVIECNANALSLFSKQEETVLSTEAFAPALRQAIMKLRATGKAESVRVVDSNTGATWLLNGTPLSTGGMVLAIIDLTDHETALREAERLRRLAEIGQMTAAVAHEIRNPLTGIRSAAQMVREDPESAFDYCGVIEEEVLKLNALCEEFLAFSKPMELVLEETDLPALVRGVCERQKPEFARAGVNLTIDSAWDIPTINLDRRRIEQVVHNLLRNAREACKPGGQVAVTITESAIVVRDNGAGISDVQIERLFSPFYTTKPDGTGLGLCNVRRIVDAHGAKIVAQSKSGEGSTFTVQFDRSRF